MSKKGHQIFGQRKCTRAEKILATPMPVGYTGQTQTAKDYTGSDRIVILPIEYAIGRVACTRTGNVERACMLPNSYDSDRATYSVSPPKISKCSFALSWPLSSIIYLFLTLNLY